MKIRLCLSGDCVVSIESDEMVGLKKTPSVNLDKKAGFCVNTSKFAGNNILYYLVNKHGELEIPVTTEGGKANSRMTW